MYLVAPRGFSRTKTRDCAQNVLKMRSNVLQKKTSPCLHFSGKMIKVILTGYGTSMLHHLLSSPRITPRHKYKTPLFVIFNPRLMTIAAIIPPGSN